MSTVTIWSRGVEIAHGDVISARVKFGVLEVRGLDGTTWAYAPGEWDSYCNQPGPSATDEDDASSGTVLTFDVPEPVPAAEAIRRIAQGAMSR